MFKRIRGARHRITPALEQDYVIGLHLYCTYTPLPPQSVDLTSFLHVDVLYVKIRKPLENCLSKANNLDFPDFQGRFLKSIFLLYI